MRSSQRIAIAIAAGLLGASAPFAYAASHTETKTVHCDVGYPSTLVTLNHTSGKVSFKQVSSSKDINSNNWAVSSNGNSLPKKATVDGGTVSWSSVKASNYTFKTVIAENQNCNGPLLPGMGTSSLKYTAKTSQ
jgi:formate-dependent phosphoribosylglycinamide formyltransferase (GAR transformylase)